MKQIVYGRNCLLILCFLFFLHLFFTVQLSVLAVPNQVATSTTSEATSLSTQRKTFFDGTYYWAFYSDGTDIVYRYSSDGQSWSSPTTLASGLPPGYLLSLIYSSGDVYVALSNTQSVYARKGTISGITISWGSWYVVFSGSATNPYYFPSITRDSANKFWVVARYYDGTYYWVRARKSDNTTIESWTGTIYDLSSTTETAVYVFPIIVPLSSEQVYALWVREPYVEGRLFNGTSWESIASIGSTYGGGTATLAGPTAVVDSTGKIYAAYAGADWAIKYKTCNSPYATTDWSAEQSVGDINYWPSLSLDSATDEVYLYGTAWMGDNQHLLRYRKIGDASSTNIRNSWERPFDKAWAYRGSAPTSYTDVTLAASDSTTADVKHSVTGKMIDTNNDYLYVGMSEKFDSVFFDLSTNAAGLSLTANYWNGSTWANLSFTDKTSNLTINEKDVVFSSPANWATTSVNGSTQYWIRFRSSTNPTTDPVGTQVTAYKTYQGITSSYSTTSKTFVLSTEGTASTYDVEFSPFSLSPPTISISAPADLNLSSITGTGSSSGNITWNIQTNNSAGYKLEWQASSATLTSGSDTIAAYTPAVVDTPETWSVAAADSEWGARLKSASTDTAAEWGTDTTAEKWLNVNSAAARQIVSRGTATPGGGSNEIVQFKVEIGANHFQPTGTYIVNITMTATTL